MGAPVAIDDIWTGYMHTKNPALRDELIAEYMPLVRFVVGRLGIPPTSLLEAEDLISYGVIGLINAIERFEPERGIRFEAFASPRIRGAVIDQLRALNWLPRSAVSRIKQIEHALSGLEQRFGRPAREEEAATELGVPVERYRQMLLEVSTTVLSLDAPMGSAERDDEMTSLSELIEDADELGPEEALEKQELTLALGKAIDKLPEREKNLLSLYYKEELTMKEISKVMSLSESRVCQLHMQAVMRLRGSLHAFRSEETVQQEAPRKARKSSSRHSMSAAKAETSADTITANSDEKITVSSGKRKHMVS